MLLWWLTLCTSLKPLMNMLTRLAYAGAFLYLSQGGNSTHRQQQQQQQGPHLAQPPARGTATSETPATKAAGTRFDDWFKSDDHTTEFSMPAGFDSPSSSDTVATTVTTKMSAVEADAKPAENMILGVYNYEKSTNFNNYLRELGVSYLLRTFAGMATPVVAISRECPQEGEDSPDCKWTIRTDTLFKSHEVSFKLGEWGKDVTMDGRKVRYRVVAGEGDRRLDRLVEVQQQVDDDGGVGKSTTLVRDFDEDGMSVTLTVNSVVSTSFFSRKI